MQPETKNAPNALCLSQRTNRFRNIWKLFFADYRGIKAVVKEMKRRNGSLKESEHCKKVLHEASILNSLGDHKSLPFLLGICSDRDPYTLVFHSSGIESLTLYKATKEKLLEKTGIVKVFAGICGAVKYIHDKGYLHNDLKANNVVLKGRMRVLTQFTIDFGKSKLIEQSEARKRYTKADYIAPEVRNGRRETTASDVYSVSKMLERAVNGRSFKVLFTNIVVKTTHSSHWCRPSVSELIVLLKALRVNLGNFSSPYFFFVNNQLKSFTFLR